MTLAYPFIATDLYSKIVEISRDMLKQSLLNWMLDTNKIIEVWEECKKLLTQEFDLRRVKGDTTRGV